MRISNSVVIILGDFEEYFLSLKVRFRFAEWVKVSQEFVCTSVL